MVFSKKKYFNTKWRYRWRIADVIVFIICLLLADVFWTTHLGWSIPGLVAEMFVTGFQFSVGIPGLLAKFLYLLMAIPPYV